MAPQREGAAAVGETGVVTERKLEGLFEQLVPPRGDDDVLVYPVQGIGRDLMRFYQRPRARLRAAPVEIQRLVEEQEQKLGDLRRRAEDAGTNATKKELAVLRKHADNLRNGLADLHKPAIDALKSAEINFSEAALWRMQDTLRIFGAAVASAAIGVARAPERKPKKGRKKKEDAHQVARLVAFHYVSITGKAPTITTKPVLNKVTGTFVELLRSVYGTLNIIADAGDQTKQVKEYAKQLLRDRHPERAIVEMPAKRSN